MTALDHYRSIADWWRATIGHIEGTDAATLARELAKLLDAADAAVQAEGDRWLAAVLAAAGAPMCATPEDCVGCGCRSLTPAEAVSLFRDQIDLRRAEAVLAERERCARLVEAHAPADVYIYDADWGGERPEPASWDSQAAGVAARIREWRCPMASEPREYTPDECRRMLLEHLAGVVRYWHAESRAGTTLAKLNGVVFSTLAALDGCADLPGFAVTTSPHPDDEGYHRGRGENWWPTGADLGGLHDAWHEFEPEGRPTDDDTLAARVRAAVLAERERCAGEAVAEVWDALAAEDKAISKGSAEHTRQFRATALAERIAARIREGGAP